MHPIWILRSQDGLCFLSLVILYHHPALYDLKHGAAGFETRTVACCRVKHIVVVT